MVVTESLRESCAWVAGRSTAVHVVEEKIAEYARQLGDMQARTGVARTCPSKSPVHRENDAAFWLTLDAINFGSGWFPSLRKQEGATGYRTIATGVRRRFDAEGRWTATQLTGLTREELAGWLDQDPEHELVGLMTQSLRDLGANVRRLYGGSFAAVVDRAEGSAIRLVETLASWRSFTDTSSYEGRSIPFLKRAQIVAADLERAGVAEFSDLDRLTMFADNLVPHVLRLDGVLWFDAELSDRIGRGELIEHGSPEEIEIRACAVHAVELLVAAISAPAPARPSAAAHPSAAQIDELLWNRGQAAKYKAVPRHRSRSTAY